MGVDFTIQYLWRYNSELKKGATRQEAISTTYRTTGRSIVINALSVMAGFSATFVSGFLSIRFFGYLTLLAIGSCLLYAIIVMPAFMLYFKPSFIEANLKRINKNKEKNEKDVIPIVSSYWFCHCRFTLAQLSDPVQLMDKSRDLTMSGNLQSTVTLTITEKNGSVRTRKLNMLTKTMRRRYDQENGQVP
ncbi:MAG: MMPL family transporter [Marinilabiliales bacterium]|nr:MMPL family transporter [Marinilabiliales bacterium]